MSVDVVELVGGGVAALKTVKVEGFVAGGGGQELLISSSLMDGSERPLGDSKNGINLLSLSG
jgi:hypothetical protein